MIYSCPAYSFTIHFSVGRGGERMTINDLHPGESGTVVQIASEGVVRRRLLDMGITPGIRVTLLRTAPLGDPVVIELRGNALSIRKSEAGCVTVREGGF